MPQKRHDFMTGFSRQWSDVESYDLSGGCDYATPVTSNSEGTLETNDVFNEHHHEKTCFVRPKIRFAYCASHSLNSVFVVLCLDSTIPLDFHMQKQVSL